MNSIAKIQRLMYQTGGYLCPHYKIQKIMSKTKKSCCGNKGDDYVPVCLLISGVCVGLAQCPRLDVKTKSELIKKWNSDLKTNTVINPQDYIK